jgi:hypothetical protein
VLNEESKQDALAAAERWDSWLEYFEEVYNNSFAKHGISRNTALQVIAACDFGSPAISEDIDGEEWNK